MKYRGRVLEDPPETSPPFSLLVPEVKVTLVQSQSHPLNQRGLSLWGGIPVLPGAGRSPPHALPG